MRATAARTWVGVAGALGLAGLGCGERTAGLPLAEDETLRLCQYVSSLPLSEPGELAYPRAELKFPEAGDAPRGDTVGQWYGPSALADLRRQRAARAPRAYHELTEAELFAWGEMRTWDLLETLADRQKEALLRARQEEERRARERAERESGG